MSASHWLERADRALISAATLIAIDPDRACSSAYYAMFYAPRAALFHIGQPERALGKTHSGLIAAFHQYLVHPGLIDGQQGRALQRELSRRLIADYEAGGVDEREAVEAIANARTFVAAMAVLIGQAGRDL